MHDRFFCELVAGRWDGGEDKLLEGGVVYTDDAGSVDDGLNAELRCIESVLADTIFFNDEVGAEMSEGATFGLDDVEVECGHAD